MTAMRLLPNKRLGGPAKAAPFAVFYPEHVPSIIWSLGRDLIKAAAAKEPNKRTRLATLLREHGYLPDAEVAKLAARTVNGVEKKEAAGAVSFGRGGRCRLKVWVWVIVGEPHS